MSIYLGVLRPGRDTSVAIKSIYKHLCRIYYAFKKESRCVVVIEKEKDAKGDKGEVCVHSNVSGNVMS